MTSAEELEKRLEDIFLYPTRETVISFIREIQVEAINFGIVYAFEQLTEPKEVTYDDIANPPQQQNNT